MSSLSASSPLLLLVALLFVLLLSIATTPTHAFIDGAFQKVQKDFASLTRRVTARRILRPSIRISSAEGNHILSNSNFSGPTDTRRNYICKASGMVVSAWSSPGIAHAAIQNKKEDDMQNKLNQEILYLPPPYSSSELKNGVANLFYPSYLAGEWEVTQTLTDMNVSQVLFAYC
jgi:hypothetical protein